jgi:hypothetical protein
MFKLINFKSIYIYSKKAELIIETGFKIYSFV